MAWAKRGRGRYYYRSVRVGDKVETEYVGTGAAAEMQARMDEAVKRHCEQMRRVWKEERERLCETDHAIAAMFDEVELAADATMIAAGYHRHKGEWRRRHAGRK